MSALPFGNTGSALPLGSALPYGSVLPYGSEFSYGGGFPSAPYSFGSVFYEASNYPTYTVDNSSPAKDTEEVAVHEASKPSTVARAQLLLIIELEREISTAIHQYEAARVEFTHCQGNDFNTLVKEQNQALTAQVESVKNAFNSLPSDYRAKPQFAELAKEFTTGPPVSAQRPQSVNQTGQIAKLSQVQQKLTTARQILDDEVALERR
jgi:hypothetical protein